LEHGAVHGERPLFVYGTLRDHEMLAAVLGRTPGAQPLAATAPGFRAVPYPGRSYPALVRRPGATAAGLLLTDLTPFERDLLDAYEGEEYRRGIVPVIVDFELHEADAYLPAVAITDAAAAWSLRRWQHQHKAAALVAERAAAAELRARLVAGRPH
jgi:gamma-glutamylcyclotransferase (GGCT)/AIG2-like uncharacterized protein YtfP